jgi:hypothetical protein
MAGRGDGVSAQSVTVPADWGAAYRHYDDDALTALASTGLLRRAAKDVEAGRVGWHADGGMRRGVVAADGQQVQLTSQGPGATRCDCPALGVCKHILAATLWLRTAPQPEPAAQQAEGGAEPPDTPDVLAEALALDLPAVFKAAGAAAVRKAAALGDVFDDAAAIVQGATLVVTIPALDLVCRYIAGAGFDGMVSEAESRARKTLHLLALAALWRLHGRAIDWPAQPSADELPTLAGVADERRFLAEARALVHEICANGWSHVSDLAAPRLRALATSARVESFPRLAALLRRLAGTASLLARRDFGADERDALELAAEIHALIAALDGALMHTDVARLPRLRGLTRRIFTTGAGLELLPLGAHWWESRSGARGLTVAFWDPEAACLRQAVLARRDASDPQFTKAAAWSVQLLWQGAPATASLAGSTLTLEQPRLADDGRLGVGGDTRVRMQPGWTVEDPRWHAAGFEDWDRLRAALASRAGLLGEQLELVLLRPSFCERPVPDEVRQELVWRVHDRERRTIVLRVSYETSKASRLENLAACAASGVPVHGVVAQVPSNGNGVGLEVVSLIITREGRLHAVSPDFETGPTPSGSLVSLFTRALKGRPQPVARTRLTHQRVLNAIVAQLERKAMTGHLHVVSIDDALRGLHSDLLALGLDALAELLSDYFTAPDTGSALALYRVARVCLDLDTGFLDA